jgi:hypothetical protein
MLVLFLVALQHAKAVRVGDSYKPFSMQSSSTLIRMLLKVPALWVYIKQGIAALVGLG